MVKYYQITPEEAALISDFNYQENGVQCLFTAKSGEQNNGNFIIKKYFIDTFSDKFKSVNFLIKSLYTVEELSPKIDII